MKIFKRLILFFSLVLIYVIVKEFLELYALAKSFHPIAGYLTLIAITGFVVYFVAIPIFRIIKIPKHYGPSTNKSEMPQVLEQRIKNFRNNDYLIKAGFDFSTINNNEESYQKIIKALQVECERIRKRYVCQLFYSSSVSQNGFIDAILILSSSINLIKEIFILYNGRVSNKDLFTIAKKVYYSMAIGGSEGIEYATEEIISSLAIKGFKSIPFIDKFISSIADGFINAVLLTRISFITENYCKLIYIESEKSLYPSPIFVIDATKHITVDITSNCKKALEKIRNSVQDSAIGMKDIVFDKAADYGKYVLNPASYVLRQSVDMVSDTTKNITSSIKDVLTFSASPFAYVLLKSSGIFKRNKK